MSKLNGNRPEVEAGGLRVLVQELFNHPSRMFAQDENLDWIHRAAMALSADDLGELTCNQIRELRQQVQTYAKLIEAQSVGLNSLARQLRWFREFRDAAVPLLEHMNQCCTGDKLCAKVKNLLNAQYDGESMWNDLLSMATEIELVPDRLCLTKWDDGRWHFCFAYLPGEFTTPLEDTPELREGFPTCFAGYAWFLSHPEILERCKQ